MYMSVASGQPDEVKAKYPMAEYKNIEHFSGVIGKFTPYTWILADGIEIQEPSLPELRRAAEMLHKTIINETSHHISCPWRIFVIFFDNLTICCLK